MRHSANKKKIKSDRTRIVNGVQVLYHGGDCDILSERTSNSTKKMCLNKMYKIGGNVTFEHLRGSKVHSDPFKVHSDPFKVHSDPFRVHSDPLKVH